MTVTKRDLAQRVNELAGLRESHGAEAVDALLEAMKDKRGRPKQKPTKTWPNYNISKLFLHFCL